MSIVGTGAGLGRARRGAVRRGKAWSSQSIERQLWALRFGQAGPGLAWRGGEGQGWVRQGFPQGIE